MDFRDATTATSFLEVLYMSSKSSCGGGPRSEGLIFSSIISSFTGSTGLTGSGDVRLRRGLFDSSIIAATFCSRMSCFWSAATIEWTIPGNHFM